MLTEEEMAEFRSWQAEKRKEGNAVEDTDDAKGLQSADDTLADYDKPKSILTPEENAAEDAQAWKERDDWHEWYAVRSARDRYAKPGDRSEYGYSRETYDEDLARLEGEMESLEDRFGGNMKNGKGDKTDMQMTFIGCLPLMFVYFVVLLFLNAFGVVDLSWFSDVFNQK